MSKILSALRETAALSLRYVGVGVCFAVAAVTASLVFQFVPTSKGAVLAFAVAFGFGLSYFFWQLTARKAAILVPRSDTEVKIRGASAPVFGVGELELPHFATSVSVVYLCTTYGGEQGQFPTEMPLQAPTAPPEVITVDANIH